MLKSVRMRKVKMSLKTGTIKRKSARNSPPMPKRKFRILARDAHRVEDLEEEVRKEANCTKRSASLRKSQRSLSAPSRNKRRSDCLMMTTKKNLFRI